MKAFGKKPMMRKNYFIKKSFQTKFILGFIFLLLVEALFITGLFMHMSGETLTTGYSGSHFVIERTSSFFVASFAIIALVVGTAMALAGSVIFVLLSHRIAGPLFRFEKTLGEMAEGNFVGRVKLRKADQLKEMQTALNKALDAIDSRLKEVKRATGEADDFAGRYANDAHVKEVKDAISKIKDKIAFFKTS
ncbi:MAG: methyl-accepting chemotaxis protein [Omnitrophica bacterium]|nr:methyl-accepting chemotaxis protein [Candidatus Omnitrophota bacterium]